MENQKTRKLENHKKREKTKNKKKKGKNGKLAGYHTRMS